jgi:hypothetical protein
MMLVKWIVIVLNHYSVEGHQKFRIPKAQEFCDEPGQ